MKPDFWFYLADTETKLKNFAQAETAYEKYLQVATDPAAKAKTLLALGATKIAAHKPDDAQKIAEEIMSLQPEGRVNAEARLLAGDVQVERQHFDEAGKAFMGVALLYDDPAITPRALQKAALAYRKGRKERGSRSRRQTAARKVSRLRRRLIAAFSTPKLLGGTGFARPFSSGRHSNRTCRSTSLREEHQLS